MVTPVKRPSEYNIYAVGKGCRVCTGSKGGGANSTARSGRLSEREIALREESSFTSGSQRQMTWSGLRLKKDNSVSVWTVPCRRARLKAG